MASNIELLRRLVHQQLVGLPGPVNNFYGAVAGQSPAILVQQTQRFLVAQIAGTRMLTPDEFYSAYTSSHTRNYQVLQATDGVIVAESITNNAGTPSTFLIRSVTENPGQITFVLNIETDSPTSEFAIYIDGVLQRKGNGKIAQLVTLGAGRHLLEIVAVARVFGLAVPPSIRFIYDLETVPTPVWSTIRNGYVDPILGTIALELEWYNDSRVGGWIVFRRRLEYMDAITIVGTVDGNGEFSLEITGDQTADIIVGADILAGAETMGTVVNASYDDIELVTVVRVKLVNSLRQSRQDWVGRIASVGQFAEQARVRRNTKGGTATWTDLGVAIGQVYEYALQAFGLFDEMQLSALSEIRRVVPGDAAPPGSIVFEPAYPIVYLDVVTAKFTTPSDQDYEGVRVLFYDKPLDGFGTSTGFNSTISLVDNNRSWQVNQFAGYFIRITGGTGEGQVATILTNTETVINLDPTTPFSIVPDTTSTFEIYRLVNVVTDYGIPETKDEVRFGSVGLGRYYFPTFDRALNIQNIADAAYWDYDNIDDQLTPLTNVLVYDRTADGKQSQTIFGMTLYSIPPAQEIIADTFEEVDGQGFDLLDSGTFGLTGNTTRMFEDSTKNWTENQFAGMWVRIFSGGANYNRIIKIITNTSNILILETDAALPPDGQEYQILEHAPNRTPTATEYWTLSDDSKIAVRESSVQFTGTAGTAFDMFIDAARPTNFRYEAVLTRGRFLASGDNSLTYKADATHDYRFEYGFVQTDNNTVGLRYRYNSGGTGAWEALLADVQWRVGTSQTLIVEVDNDIHTFKMADAYGHDERNVGRVQLGGSNPAHTYIGWAVHGSPTDGAILGDGIDSVRILDFDTLVRIKYKLLPYEDPVTRRGEFLEVPQWVGSVLSGNAELLKDTTKLWSQNELVGAWIRITDGPGQGSDLPILANNATTIVPDGNFSAALTNQSTYLVYEKYYTGTERLRWWAGRLPKQPQYLLFHGERLGSPDEPENRVLIDPNSVPEIFLTLTQQEPYGANEGTLIATVVPDDDVATYRLLLRKGNWPILDAAVQPDPGPTGPGTGPDPQPNPPTAIRTVAVTDATELIAALNAALPGDSIELADGTYTLGTGENFTSLRSGTPDHPIVISGGVGAIVDGGDGFIVKGDYTWLSGFTIQNATSGVVVSGGFQDVVDQMVISGIAGTGVTFKDATEESYVQLCTISDCGVYGIQIGAVGDACNKNRVLDNDLGSSIVSAHVCLMGTSSYNVVQDNNCNANGVTDGRGVIANLEGTRSNMFRNNTITGINDAQVSGLYCFRATANQFTLNTISGTLLEYGINIDDDSIGDNNILFCDNTGTSNVPCDSGTPPGGGVPIVGGVGVGLTDVKLTDILPVSYTGSVKTATPATIVTDIKNAQARGWKRFWCVVARSRGNWAPNGYFDLDMFKAKVDEWDGYVDDVQPYVDSGFFLGYVIDEPNISAFHGSISGADLKAMCLYVKNKFPGIITGIRMSYEYFKSFPINSSWEGICDYAWAAYRYDRKPLETPTQYYTRQKAGAAALGMKCAFAINYLNGGLGESGIEGQNGPGFWVMSPNEIKRAADAAKAVGGSPTFTMWTHIEDLSYLQPYTYWLGIENRSDYKAAFQYAVDIFKTTTTTTTTGGTTTTITNIPTSSSLAVLPSSDTTVGAEDSTATSLSTDTVSDQPPTDGIPDPRYTKYLGNTDFRNQAYQVGLGWWYGAAIPYDTNGAPGPVSWAKVYIGSDTPGPIDGNKLVMEVQPPPVTPAGNTLDPAPTVQLADASGASLAIAGVTITATIKAGVLALLGTVTVVTDANGQATFDDLQLNGDSGEQDIIVFSASGYTSVETFYITIDATVSANPSFSIEKHTSIVTLNQAAEYWVRLRNDDGTAILTAGVPVNVGIYSAFQEGQENDTAFVLYGGAAGSTSLTQTPSVTLNTDSNGYAKFSLKFTGLGGGTAYLVYSSPGYDSKQSPLVVINAPILYNLSNLRYNFRSLTVGTWPNTITYSALVVNWAFSSQFDEPNTAGTVDIYWWTDNPNNQTLAVANYPVWTQKFTTLYDSPIAPGQTPDYEGNYAFPSNIRLDTSPYGIHIYPWITVNYKVVFKVNGVVNWTGVGSASFYGTTTAAVV